MIAIVERAICKEMDAPRPVVWRSESQSGYPSDVVEVILESSMGTGLVCRHSVDPVAKVVEYQALIPPLDAPSFLLLSDLGQTPDSRDLNMSEPLTGGEWEAIGFGW